ncbi:MAG: hypothetical protein FWD73_10335 [Polyangiaceae bacterium]|nr:hypothetical protein [Polyangiaceae bacterium]
MISDWPWYEVVAGEALDQGDIVPACPVFNEIEVADDTKLVKARMTPVPAIVLTQTCDLVQNKTDSVIVCEMWSVGKVVLQDPTLRAKAEETCRKERLTLPASDSKTLERDIGAIIDKNGPLRSHFNAIIKGERPAYAMLEEHPQSGSPRWVVSFRDVYKMPKGLVSKAALDAGKRLRLRSPYREHVSASFGRFFTRIGLPIDLVQYKSSTSIPG